MNQIKIRSMRHEDEQGAVGIMTSAFRGKLVALKSWEDSKIDELIIHIGMFRKKNMDGFYVAEIDAEIVGIMYLKSKKNEKEPGPKFSGIDAFKKFGVIRLLFTGFEMLLISDKVQHGEIMVDFLAVSPEHRGQGIGGKLLEYGEAVAKKTQGIKKYSLMVIGRNKGARRLYERLGFRVVKTSHHPVLKVLTTIEEYHYMVKELK